jgi:spermidine/putrescine transport system permease protein
MKQMPHTSEKKSLKEHLSAIVLCGPLTAWSLLFIVVPIVILAVMSFMTKGALGVIVPKFTLDNYKALGDKVYLNVIVQSLIIAGWTTGLTVLLGYPFATAMARMRARTSGVMMVLLMIPMWVSGLVIIYSFVILLNHSGIINTFLMHIGLIKTPKSMLYTNFSVICGMLYMFLPFAVLPMYSSIEKLDYNLVEASQDLGASPVRTFFKVTLPLTSPGIFAAVILTFIPCVGYYMVTDMLGGGTSMLIGNLIDRQFTIARNWPFGAALSMVLAIVIFAMVGIYTKLGGNLDDLG